MTRRTRGKPFFVACVVLVAALISSTSARIIHVAANAPADFNNIQAAINDANDGDTVIVQPGTYTGPGNRDIDFLGKAITLRSTDPNDPCVVAATIIDCNGSEDDPHRGFTFYNGEDQNSVLSGFAIRDGHCVDGGGIYLYQSSPRITNCVITGCRAYGDFMQTGGGGICCSYGSSPLITDSTLTRCTADRQGGAIRSWYGSPGITNCLISDCTAWQGAGIYAKYDHPKVSNCALSGNTATYGGGIYVSSYGSMTIDSCVVTANSAGSGGGAGIHISRVEQVEIARTFILGNKCSATGGGLYCRGGDVLLTHCTLTGNVALESGGAVHVTESPNLAISNCILSFNYAWLSGSAIRIISYGSYEPTVALSYSHFSSFLFGGISCDDSSALNWGPGNIFSDPHFVSRGYWADPNSPTIPLTPYDPNAIWVDGDYHLKSQAGRWNSNTQAWVQDNVTSLCIDAGNPGSPLGQELPSGPDPHGNESAQNLRINMGAYGGTAEASIPPYNWAKLSDLTNDGIVDFTDLERWTDYWLSTTTDAPSDLNRNGLVNVADFALLARDWRARTDWFLLAPPGRATDPNPPDGATDVELHAGLSWTAGPPAASHDVYFGVTNPPPFIGNQISTTFDPGAMQALTTYFWRVDQLNSADTTTGAVWTFTTASKGRFCFPADTPVWVDGILVQISEVTPGRKPAGFETVSTHLARPEVESIDEHEGIFSESHDISLETGNCMTVIGSHSFLTASSQWTGVQDLRPGQKLQSLTDPLTIQNIVRRQTPYVGRVYNLKIRSSDRYYVGRNNLIARDY